MSSKVKKSKDAFRTISEVADHLNVQQHVLRFWETKFSQIKPMKRGGGRRYYRPEDVSLLERIHHLLYTEGYTIKGVQKLLREQGKAQFVMQAQNQNASSPAKQKVSFETSQAQQAPADVESKPQAKKMNDQQRAVLEIMLDELKAMRAMLNN
ncbi:MAG: MerR family transcriptional regulator [Pseudomonadota bacterium]